MQVTDSNLRVIVNASRNFLRALLHLQKIHWWIKNCQTNCTCGTILNHIAPFAPFTLQVSSTGCKKTQRNPQCGHHLPTLRNAMFLCTQRTAHCMTRGALCTHMRRSSTTDMHKTDMERTELDLVHFSNKVHTDVSFCAANLPYHLLAGAEIPSF